MKLLVLALTFSLLLLVEQSFAQVEDNDLAGNDENRPTCCPSGWIRFNETNSCYLVQNNANWAVAEQICVSKKAHLVSIHSDAEENFILNLTITGQPTSNVNSGVWIGLKAVVTGIFFEWTDGSPLDYTKWAVSQPDGAGEFGPPANCVDVHPDTLIGREALTNAWDDDNCYKEMRAFVCKQSVQSC